MPEQPRVEEFTTAVGDRTFSFAELDDEQTVLGLGHQDKEQFARAVNEWWRLTSGDPIEDGIDIGATDVHHLYAVTEPAPTAEYDYWLNWDKITAETPGAFPITEVGL